MLCQPQFDLNDPMSSFEVMDPKMDSRMHRKQAMSIKVATEKGILLTEFSDSHRHALL